MRRCTSIARWSLLLPLFFSAWAEAEDFKLTNGRTFRNARVLEVRPDAVIIWHRDGVLMADFEQLPPEKRKQYGYDPKKAASFRKQSAANRRAVAEEDRRLIAAYETRKMSSIQSRMESGSGERSTFAGFNESELRYLPDAAERAYDNNLRLFGEEIGREEEERLAKRREPETFWNAPFWKNPVVTFIGALLGAGGGPGRARGGGFESEPRGWR